MESQDWPSLLPCIESRRIVPHCACMWHAARAAPAHAGNVTAVPPATPLAPSLSEEYDTSLVFGTPNVEYWNAAIGQFATAPSVGLLNTSETAGTESGSTTVIGGHALCGIQRKPSSWPACLPSWLLVVFADSHA